MKIRTCLLTLLLPLCAAPAVAQAANTLVVYNTALTDSKAVADYYMSKRKIPTANACPINAPPSGAGDQFTAPSYDGVDYPTFLASVLAPIQGCLNRVGRDTIAYLVLTYGTPFIVRGDPIGVRALDSMLALPWVTSLVAQSNPYLAADQSGANLYRDFVPILTFRASQAAGSPVPYLVWRLDGATPAIAQAQVDAAMSAEASGGPKGIGCFDLRTDAAQADLPDTYAGIGEGDWDIRRAWQLATAAGFTSTIDTNITEIGFRPAALRCDNTALYVGWYSMGSYHNSFSFSPGSMGWHYDSLSCLSPRLQTSWCGGAIAHGITVTGGAVAEPQLYGLPHYDTFLRSVMQGATVGEAMGRATELVNWMIINIGDPLYRPWPAGKSVTIPTIHPPLPSASPVPVDPPAAVRFLGVDTHTQGAWRGVYGGENRLVPEDGVASGPPMLRVAALSAATATTALNSADPRDLQQIAGPARIAKTWGGTTTDWDVDFFDGQAHQVAFYVLDRDRAGRAQQVTVTDRLTQQVLDSRVAAGLGDGQYWVYTVTGDVGISFATVAGPDTVVEGWFVDPVGSAPALTQPATTCADPKAQNVGASLPCTYAPKVTGQSLGITGEDYTNGGSEKPDGIKDWHVRLAGVTALPTRISARYNGALFIWPPTGDAWTMHLVQAGATLDVWFQWPWPGPTTFALDLLEADGSTDSVSFTSATQPPTLCTDPVATNVGQPLPCVYPPTGNAAIIAQVQALIVQIAALQSQQATADAQITALQAQVKTLLATIK